MDISISDEERNSIKGFKWNKKTKTYIGTKDNVICDFANIDPTYIEASNGNVLSALDGHNIRMENNNVLIVGNKNTITLAERNNISIESFNEISTGNYNQIVALPNNIISIGNHNSLTLESDNVVEIESHNTITVEEKVYLKQTGTNNVVIVRSQGSVKTYDLNTYPKNIFIAFTLNEVIFSMTSEVVRL